MKPATRDEAEAAKNGPHAHWAMFDEALECARYHALHSVVSTAPFDAVAAADLVRDLVDAAHGYGYGSEDSYLVNMQSRDPASPEAEAYREMHDNPQDHDEYLVATGKSVNLLASAAATDEARRFVGQIAPQVQDAFERGRKERKAEQREAIRPNP